MYLIEKNKMKEYHTHIEINAPRNEVWNSLTSFENYGEWNPLVSELTGDISEGGTINTRIVPLNKTFSVKLLSYRENEEIIWKGRQVASFLLAGKHYYRLKEHKENVTILEHGEYFTGFLSTFIPKRLLEKNGKGV
jgi:hypothetical protein